MSSLEEDPYVIAVETNKTVYLPENGELFIDIDSDEDFVHFTQMLKVLGDNDIWVLSSIVTESSTPGHRHIRLRLGNPYRRLDDPILRIALQAALGSDRKRELLSILRIGMRVNRPPTIFFEDN